MAAKAGGLVRDQPRIIPLQAVSDVAIKEAGYSRQRFGWMARVISLVAMSRPPVEDQ
jgi:hypothetical protein